MIEEIPNCPFCDAPPASDECGTMLDFGCTQCGQAYISIQISDLMTIEERCSVEFSNGRYPQEFVDRALDEAVRRWSDRTTAPTKKLFLLVSDGGDGSYSIQATMNEAWIKQRQEAYDSGEEFEGVGFDADGFNYKVVTVPGECTLQSLGFRYDVVSDD